VLRVALAFLAFACVASCGNPARPAFVVGIVDNNGNNPLGSVTAGTVTIRVRQLDMPIVEREAHISGGDIDAFDVPITSFGIVTRIEVLVDDASIGVEHEPDLIGASPAFVPLGYTFVRVVVGEPATCEALSAPMLSSARIDPNLVAVEGNLVSIGGEDITGAPSSHVEILSPVQLTYSVAPNEYPLLERPISAGGAVRLGTGSSSRVLALSSVRRAVLFFLEPDRTSERDVDLSEVQAGNQVHPGVGPSSAILDLGNDGVVILGGLDVDEPASGITWVDVDGYTTISELATPRERPAAIRMGDYVLVAGGQAADAPLFELVSISSPGAASITSDVGDPRFDAILVSDGSDGAWLGFGESADGTLLDTTVRIDGCPDACVATASTPIDRPRRGARAVARTGDTLVLGGADETGPTNAVDRVRFVGGMPVVEPLGELDAARDRPGAAPIGSGVIVVAGGLGVRPELSALSDLEICFPETLEPL
jgi:hypothetical protein